MMNLQEFKVENCADSVFYIPNFISEGQEKEIIGNIDKTSKLKWTQLSHRRLINYGGVPHAKGMIAEELPAWLQSYVNRVNSMKVFDDKLANHVLINEYMPNEGIMAHLDGPLFYPTISTISVGSHTFLEFLEPTEDDIGNAINKPIGKLMLERRSLLVLKENMYHKYLHCIEERKGDVIDEKVLNLQECGEHYFLGDQLPRQRRISLTIRHVPKTSKMKIKL